MRVYKYIIPILLMFLVTGFCLKKDNTVIENVNVIECNYDNVGQLKKEIDKKIEIHDEILSTIKEDGYKLAQTAYKEIGNVGGEKYWSWYGFKGYAPWCCCFVSWCADQRGLIDSGVMPKFSSVSAGESLFRSRGQWLWGYEQPSPGMVIFFDYTNKELENIRDGSPDHVGIVKCVKDGYIYCIEGNYNNMCQETRYVIGDYCIYGYGVPEFNK